MNKVEFERKKHFGAAMTIASRLLQSELITENEHKRIKTALIQKYHPKVSPQRDATGSPIPKIIKGRKAGKEV